MLSGKTGQIDHPIPVQIDLYCPEIIYISQFCLLVLVSSKRFLQK
ncbi:hypothetical protein SAMN05216269_105260 [Flavobacterium xinjiangense]|uniref:Uncharacterized protein n=1 Tax=Flavobacterium xinjiangense TaxID=178356 RepID=A0A1M7KC03_9FLAO|nr:hypothetical protein SAMN05216269_105260 [Flavobacterium xinjiangense]